MAGTGLKISEVATRAGIGAKAIRFYEAQGVLPPAARGANRYRLYATETVDVLRFIKQAQSLGLSLAEIKEILTIRRGGRPPCTHVHRLLVDKAKELDDKLEALLALRRRLRQSLRAWRQRPGTPAAVCPHIEASGPAGRRNLAAPRSRSTEDNPRSGHSPGNGVKGKTMEQIELRVSGIT